MVKVKIAKKALASIVKKSSTLEAAATKLGVSRRTLYTLRKEAKMPIRSRK